MGHDWRRSAAGGVLLVVLGFVGLWRIGPSLGWGGGGCIAPIPGLAPLGIHFDLLVESVACPERFLLPGAEFGPVVQFLVVLSTSALAVALFNLGLSLGLGLWIRGTFGDLRRWVRTRLATYLPTLGLSPTPPLVTVPYEVMLVRAGCHRLAPPRGPPACVR